MFCACRTFVAPTALEHETVSSWRAVSSSAGKSKQAAPAKRVWSDFLARKKKVPVLPQTSYTPGPLFQAGLMNGCQNKSHHVFSLHSMILKKI